jgi:hypothetical protein
MAKGDRSISLNYGSEKVVSTTKVRPLGTAGETPDGRRFRYAQNGAVALSAGNLVQAPAALESGIMDTAITVSTAVGDWNSTAVTPGIQIGRATRPTGESRGTQIGIVIGSGTTGVTHAADTYTDGYINIETSPGYGMYRVALDESTGSTATDYALELEIDDTLVEVVTQTSKLSLNPNPYSATIVTPAAAGTGLMLGVAPVDVAISAYFWVQTRGLASVDYDTNVVAVVGGPVRVGSAVAGAAQGQSTLATTVAALYNATYPVIGTFSTGIPDDTDRVTVMLTVE